VIYGFLVIGYKIKENKVTNLWCGVPLLSLRNASAPARVLTTFGTFDTRLHGRTNSRNEPHHGNLSAFINLPYFVSLLPVSAVPTSANAT
jgi:hypothetical protein